jgi:hypothetical protein
MTLTNGPGLLLEVKAQGKWGLGSQKHITLTSSLLSL